MDLRPVVLLAPSAAAALEIPRRLASRGKALALVYPLKLLELAKILAEPALLGRGLRAFDPGHAALLAGRFLDDGGGLDAPPGPARAPVARALARTLMALRAAGVRPAEMEALARSASGEAEDQARLSALFRLYARFHEALEGRVADPATLLRAAKERIREAEWLRGATVLVVDELPIDPLERELLAALRDALPVARLERSLPPGLRRGSFAAWAEAAALPRARMEDTILAPLAPPAPPPGLLRLRESLFEPPQGPPLEDGSVELLTAPGESAEAASIARRLLRAAARGVPFEDMGVVFSRADLYAPLFMELFERLRIPCRLHPSLPHATGRSARSLLLLLRCRGLSRPAVMEFLTFAPVPWTEMLGEASLARPARWDALSRDAQIVSELPRWIVGLHAHAEAEREAADREEREERRAARLLRAADAERLLEVVKLLSGTLDTLAGEASWSEWSERLHAVLDQWVGPGEDREAVGDVLSDLGGLSSASPRAPWSDVEQVLEARFEWERMPRSPVEGGAVHVGVVDALAGLPFRVLAVAGLVEGGYPGVFRPDPLLLDPEREALARARTPAGAAPAALRRVPAAARQLSLLDGLDAPETKEPGPPAGEVLLPTAQDRLAEARRGFHGVVTQAQEQLVLSYPRADPRSGRERLPSLFFVAAASALLGRPAATSDLDRVVAEDDLSALPLAETLDRSERDRKRVKEGGEEAAQAVAAGSPFFKQSRLAASARWSSRLTRYDGLVSDLPPELLARLDPAGPGASTSASRLATFARCGFQYLLEHVLRLEPALEPEERRRLDPLERGSLFHDVAERFLRERRDRAELPVRVTPEMQDRLRALAEDALEGFVAGSPPRFTLLWEREKRRFHASLLRWLAREADAAERSTPLHFELGFGLPLPKDADEPHARDPLVVALPDGRTLRINGKIDRIDRKADGTLLLRDYKTGKAPNDDGGIFRGGKQLQIPIYVRAAASLLPGQRVSEAFLDYVDGGRQVAWDPEAITGAAFEKVLGDLVDVVRSGIFVQEHTSCDFCDFKAACGPKGLLERRRVYKTGDRALQRVLALRRVV
jgi:RecB family exonuclease